MCIFVAHTIYKIMIYIRYISKYFMNYLKLLETTSAIPICGQLNHLSKLLPNDA